MTSELLVLEEVGLVFSERVIHKINKLSDGGVHKSEQDKIMITDKDSSIIDIEVIIK